MRPGVTPETAAKCCWVDIGLKSEGKLFVLVGQLGALLVGGEFNTITLGVWEYGKWWLTSWYCFIIIFQGKGLRESLFCLQCTS